MMRYMVTERFRNGDAGAVYRRFAERGRMMPDGLTYLDSWISDDMATCWQLMETEDRALFDQWISNWSDLVDFEVTQVLSSAEARMRALPQDS